MVMAAKHSSFSHSCTILPRIPLSTSASSCFLPVWEPQKYFGGFRSKVQTEQISHRGPEGIRLLGKTQHRISMIPLIWGVQTQEFCFSSFSLRPVASRFQTHIWSMYKTLCNSTGICLPCYCQLLNDRVTTE